MELWNRKDLRMPPNKSVKMRSVDLDLIHLKSIFDGALKMLEDKHILHREAALLSRYLYRSQLRMRGHKGMMFLDKMNRGLKRYISLDLQYVYSNFRLMLSCDGDEWIYAPTKQMLQYVLVRTQGFCKVMHYLSTVCQDAAFYYRETLCLGHMLNETLLCLGLISRIWYCARYFMICGCHWYSQLVSYLGKLKISGVCWLPAEYEFPADLRTWLIPDPVARQLTCEANVQKISDEMSKIEEFKDLGKLIKREELAKKCEKETFLPRRNANASFFSKDETSLTVSLDTNLPSQCASSLIQTKNELLNTMPFLEDLGDLGKPISREQLLSQKARNENACMTSNKFTHNGTGAKLMNTASNITSKSRNVMLFMTTTRDLCKKFKKDSGDNLRELIRNDDFLSFRTSRDNISKSASNVDSDKEYSTILKTPLHTSLKADRLATFDTSEKTLCTMKCNDDTPKDLQEICLHNSFLSSKTSTCGMHFSDVEILAKSESPLETGSLRKIDNVIQQKSVETLSCENKLNDDMRHNKSIHDAMILPAYKNGQTTDMVSKFDSSRGHISSVSEDKGQCIIAARPISKKKQNKKSSGNWDIINGIRTFNDLKEFLHSEKKARAKGKCCVTSELDSTEWNILLDAINKFKRKHTVSKSKGDKKNKSVMTDIRNTLISFII